MRSDLPETNKLKEAELASEEHRLANFVNFIGEGRGSRALAEALVETERRIDGLREELEGLRGSRDKVFQAPPLEWIRDRMSRLQEVLERRTARSALLLRRFLGPIRLEPVPVEVGRPYYRGATAIDTLALIETPTEPDDPDGGSRSLRSWSCRESNPGPPTPKQAFYERSLRLALGASRPADGADRRPARIRCPVLGSRRASDGEPALRRRIPGTQADPGPTAVTQGDGDRALRSGSCWLPGRIDEGTRHPRLASPVPVPPGSIPVQPPVGHVCQGPATS